MTHVSSAAAPEAVTPPSARRVAVASAVGATIEWYDFFLYGTAAGLVFDKLFFNGLDGPAAQFAAFGTFAVGFLARPVGGFFFGHFGDRVGRKKMLLLTLVIMGVGTAAIGLLPSYDAIGWWAPVLLITLRVLQGIGVGGEYGGAVLLAVEYAPAERRGFFGSFAHIGVPGGLLLASGAFSLASLLPDEAFLGWGWRACFLASVVLLAVGAYIRLSVMETPAFARVQERKEVSRIPLRDLLAAQPKRLLLGMGTRFIEGFTFNFFSVYLLAYVVTNLELPKSLALGGVMAGAALGVVLVPITGALSDRVGRKPVYRVGAWLALVIAFPVAALVQSANPVAVFAVFVVGSRRALRHDLRPARRVLVRAVRHPLPLHGAEHALPDVRHRGLRPDAAHRGVAGEQGRRQPVAGGGLQRRGRGDQPAVGTVPARDPRPGPGRAHRGPEDDARRGGSPAGVNGLTPAGPGCPGGTGAPSRRSPTSPGTSGPRPRPLARGRHAARR